jgi:hypothetical protein
VRRALVVGVALLLVPASLATTARRAHLVPTSGSPLRVKGTGFVPRERVQIKVTAGSKRVSRKLRASTRGSFVVTFTRVRACEGPTVVARGSRGSRASFTISEIACLQK